MKVSKFVYLFIYLFIYVLIYYKNILQFSLHYNLEKKNRYISIC